MGEQRRVCVCVCLSLPVLVVCASGDNALDYVIEGAKVSAVDFNPCQIALCELKVRFRGVECELKL